MISKLELPKGKINIRHSQMRNVHQCYAGRNYIAGASGDYVEDAIKELIKQYNVPLATVVKIHSYRKIETIIIL